ncbi:hypothetical protein [Butyrivibrio fibrisolvens]|uniref:hypothetical protein n=1 Tax=Butyrivibrio fibrisolvens TaxID=831 RepID=UPI0012BD1317|nr:hypothetical protein [Butyrivibrio fibrisolvens]
MSTSLQKSSIVIVISDSCSIGSKRVVEIPACFKKVCIILYYLAYISILEKIPRLIT